jgi:5-azacytidine-induced protein 1
MAAEKRILQERCDKLMRSFDETDTKYKDQIKLLQQKHLDEIKRLRKAQMNSENIRKQQCVVCQELTVKGLEPEVQRIIQRHQQEMSEMRAWHSDELRETEDRYQRKLNMQLQEMRDKFSHELETVIAKEKEAAAKRLEAEIRQKESDFESHKRRLISELHDLRERATCNELKLKDLMQESVRKAQIKSEIELENLKQEYEAKIQNVDRKHENELHAMKEVHEAEKVNLASNHSKKLEESLKEKEAMIVESKKQELEKELREKEKQLREEFEKTRKGEELLNESRIR